MDMVLEYAFMMPTVVSFVVAFGLGWVWYSDALFGKKWRDGIGIAVDDTTPMAHAMIAQAVGTYLLAIMVTMMSGNTVMVVLLALIIAVLIKANGYFSQKSKYAIMVEAGYVIAMIAVMVLVHMMF